MRRVWLMLFLLPFAAAFAEPELVELLPGGIVPPSAYRRWDSRTIAEWLVERRRREHVAEGNAAPVDLMRHSEIVIKVWQTDAEGLAANGVLNQHLSGHSSANYQPELRAQIEDAMMGVKLEEKYDADPKSRAHHVRPKYGYLLATLPIPGATVRNSMGWGKINVVLKDSVKKRATLTISDSINGYGPGRVDPKMWARGLHFFSDGKLPLPQSSDFLSSDAYHFLLPLDYYEVQIWGQISLDDIAEFRVEEGTPKGAIEALKKTGLPVFQASEDAVIGGFWGPRRGKLLNPEAASKVIRPGNPTTYEEPTVAEYRKEFLESLFSTNKDKFEAAVLALRRLPPDPELVETLRRKGDVRSVRILMQMHQARHEDELKAVEFFRSGKLTKFDAVELDGCWSEAGYRALIPLLTETTDNESAFAAGVVFDRANWKGHLPESIRAEVVKVLPAITDQRCAHAVAELAGKGAK